MRRSLLRGRPPKVIQLRIGNCSTMHIYDLFIREESAIKKFLNNPNEALFIIT
ncbi:MAG: hypothetical protein KC594_00345 [Nitrospira sp.]|nr:hypothetical protein [Nitrospira sp.]